ncbi:MAG: hypothetical protein II805_06265, partial [Candidatus Methanomethylophilus sp.]|nr:hypothetical protein [Methanomethylophilus sp.]
MVFQEGEQLYLQGEDGKRYWFRYAPGMIKLGGMGAIDGNRLKDLEDGDAVDIVGRRFNVFRPGVIELIESLDRGAQIITSAATVVVFLAFLLSPIGWEMKIINTVKFRHLNYQVEKYDKLGMKHNELAHGKYMAPAAFVLPLAPMVEESPDHNKMIH